MLKDIWVSFRFYYQSIIKNLRDENFILSTTIKKYESYNTFKFNKYLNDILNRNK